MSAFRRTIGKFWIWSTRGRHVAGWGMTPEEALVYFKSRGKSVLTILGFSIGYQHKDELLKWVFQALETHHPDQTLINIGATRGGVGEVYPFVKAMGFDTTGIVSTEVFQYPGALSHDVNQICFIKDKVWGGRLAGSDELSPTSKAMVLCSDLMVAIGGGEIVRDELLAGRVLGKPIQYFPAEMNHEAAIRRAKYMKLPLPESFVGSAHDLFGK
jgi:hypothetical protein